MLANYFILGMQPDASDEEIRKSYLELVKKHSPEKEPVRFQQISEAYEAVKDKRRRISGRILGGFVTDDYQKALEMLMNARAVRKRRAGLQELLQVEENAE